MFLLCSSALCQLAYLNMLGYDMGWATFAVVEAGQMLFLVRRCNLLTGDEHQPFCN